MAHIVVIGANTGGLPLPMILKKGSQQLKNMLKHCYDNEKQACKSFSNFRD